MSGKPAGKHRNNHLADMSLPPAERTRRKATRTSRKPVPAQMSHGSSPAGRRKRRDGERKMDRARRGETWG